MLTVAKLFHALHGLPPDTHVVVGIIEGGRYTALDATPEAGVEEGPALLYILCERSERPIRTAAAPPPVLPGEQPEASPPRGIWADAPPSVAVPTDEPAAIVPIKDACPKCGDRHALRIALVHQGRVECLACGHRFRPGGEAESAL